jgi:hypothetical protein
MLKSFFRNTLLFFKIFNNINKINVIKPKFVFYSENKSYQKYAYLIIEYLAKKFPGKIYYVSSDTDDFIDIHNIKNVYVGKGFLLQYFFKSVLADNLFMTVTDLNNSMIKKNKFVKNYIYFFHGAVSTTKIYTSTAFDNYDTILCNGEYHIKEIELREKLENLKKKKLVKSGFFYFDYLNNKIEKSIDSNEILVAPSWNKNKKNFINEDFEKIIERLIDSGYRVRFRPHPETIKRSLNLMTFYRDKFKGSNFVFDNDTENLNAMQKAKCLITDNSGISIEYMMLFKKPAVYYNDFEKIHNEEFDMYKNLNTIDDTIKNKFGFKFDKNQIFDIQKIIQQSITNFDKKEIDYFLDNNFYNLGKTIKYFEDNLQKICI